MKNYRILVAICLPAFMLLSVYMMFSNAKEKENMLRELQLTAEQYSEDGLHEKAAGIYSEMIEMKNDIQFYLCAIEMYYDAEKNQQCFAWAELTKEEFPDRPEGYEWLVRLYLDDNYIGGAYEVIDEFNGRKLQSPQMDDYIARLSTSYFTDYTSCTNVSSFSGGFIGIEKKGLWGIGKENGKVFVDPGYSRVGYCCNSTIPVQATDGTWYFMDAEGELFINISANIPGKIIDVGLYNNELFPINVDGEYSYYTIDFQKKYSGYDYAGSYSGGVAAVMKDGKWSLLDTEGEIVSQMQFDSIALDERGVCCVKGIIIAKTGELYHIYDSTGNLRSETGFKDAKCAGQDGIIPIKVDGLWGFARDNGEIVIEPQYLDAKSFSNGVAAVKNTLSWGYIDIDNQVVIDFQYSECTSFSGTGSAFAKAGDEWSILRFYRTNH